MKKSSVKRYLFLLVIFGVLVTSYMIVDTYALFETNGTGVVSEDVGKWIIKLNNTDISGGVSEDFTINNFIYTDNSNVENGFIAPGRNGYFDIVVDAKGTDVAVRYDISVDFTQNSYPDNISFRVENLSGGDAILSDVSTYSGVISLNSINTGLVTIRVHIEWIEDGLHDLTDSELLSGESASISIPVNVKVLQYLGEEITPYVPSEP